MSDDLRLGLVGAGRWGRNLVATIARLPGVRLAAVASRNPETAGRVPPACAVEPDWRALLDPRRIDAVIVATPPATHGAIARAAIAAGLPVLVEKPLTMDPREARELREAAAASGGFVMVDHTHLFHPAWRALKRAAPGFGRVRAIDGLAGNMGPFRGDAPPLWDWGAHDVALCLDLVGGPAVAVRARCVDHRRTAEGLGEVVEVDATFGGVPARLRFGNLMPRARRMAVQLDRGVLVYDDLAEHKLVAHEGAEDAGCGRPGEPLPFEPGLPLTVAVGEFCAAAAAGSRSLEDLDRAVQVVEILGRCSESLDLAETLP